MEWHWPVGRGEGKTDRKVGGKQIRPPVESHYSLGRAGNMVKALVARREAVAAESTVRAKGAPRRAVAQKVREGLLSLHRWQLRLRLLLLLRLGPQQPQEGGGSISQHESDTARLAELSNVPHFFHI